MFLFMVVSATTSLVTLLLLNLFTFLIFLVLLISFISFLVISVPISGSSTVFVMTTTFRVLGFAML